MSLLNERDSYNGNMIDDANKYYNENVNGIYKRSSSKKSKINESKMTTKSKHWLYIDEINKRQLTESSDTKSVDTLVTSIWDSFNDLSIVTKKILKDGGQNGAIGAFEKQFLNPLKDAIIKIDNITDEGIFKV